MSSENDHAVLNAILNPFWPEEICKEEVELDDGPDEATDDILKARELEKLAISLAETGKLMEAQKLLDEAITKAPQLPSLFNNRAQVYRLLFNEEEAIDDLDKAIQLSKGQGKSACQAFCQRGLLKKKNNKEEEARQDFQSAANLGSSFAKLQLVQLNPYAALCNQMVSQIMNKVAFYP